MLSLPAANWFRLFGWLAIGLCIYFGYGMRHSTLGKNLRKALKEASSRRRPARES